MNESHWYLYLLECSDGSLYCGIAKNVDRRIAEHTSGKGARYTRGRGPFRVVWQTTQPMTMSEALKLEILVKAMPRERKLVFVDQLLGGGNNSGGKDGGGKDGGGKDGGGKDGGGQNSGGQNSGGE